MCFQVWKYHAMAHTYANKQFPVTSCNGQQFSMWWKQQLQFPHLSIHHHFLPEPGNTGVGGTLGYTCQIHQSHLLNPFNARKYRCWGDVRVHMSNTSITSPKLTLPMLQVANLANTKWCKKPEKWMEPCWIGTHLRVLSESYSMNTNMTGFRRFSKIFPSYCFGRK